MFYTVSQKKHVTHKRPESRGLYWQLCSLRPWHHPAAAAGNTWLHPSAPLAAQQPRPKPCWLQDLGSDAAACVRTSYEQRRWAEAAPHCCLGWYDAERHWLGCRWMAKATQSMCVQRVDSSNTFYDLLLDWKNSSVTNMLFKCVYFQ